nr:MAG TPA: hypothetical protein [Bacteriophage sp.]
MLVHLKESFYLKFKYINRNFVFIFLSLKDLKYTVRENSVLFFTNLITSK